MPQTIEVKLKRLPHASKLPLPCFATAGAAGADLHAALSQPLTLAPGAYATIGTGFSIALPAGYEAQVRPRSGLAAKHGVSVLNAPGTIDADYRGEIKVILINHGNKPFDVEHGIRIAQIVIAPVVRASFVATPIDLTTTDRGDGGFGSTGLAAR